MKASETESTQKKLPYATIDEYIMQCEPEIQELLNKLRSVIKEAAPEAGEKISWSMPTFTLHGNLVHFMAHKSHIGFYPGDEGVEAFKDRLTEYKTSKGAIQFPINKPVPYDLITEIVKFRAQQNIKVYEDKKMKK